jgi:O-antigen ligase
LGCGYGQYRVEHLPYAADRNADLPVEKGRGYIAHNVALSVLAETGLVGLGLLLTLLGLWTCDALRLWRNTATPLWARQQGLLSLATLGAWLVNGMFHDVSVVPMSNMTLCFIAGVTAALRPWTQRAEHGAAAVQ